MIALKTPAAPSPKTSFHQQGIVGPGAGLGVVSPAYVVGIEIVDGKLL